MNTPIKRYDSIFWVEVHKIKPNPMQPRQEFDEERLRDLSESIRLYGVLQPLVVSRKEIENERGRAVEYELIAGERRLRAAQMAGLYQVPVIIRDVADDRTKLELTIIENLQREDLNAIEKAQAFKRLTEEFRLKHHEIALRMGKSREYVTNTIRLLMLPVEIQTSLIGGEITEGHCRPLLMLADNKEDQFKLFQEIINKKISVRKAEKFSRDIAKGGIPAAEVFSPPMPEIIKEEIIEELTNEIPLESPVEDPEIKLIEEKLASGLNALVRVEKEGEKRKVLIEFLSNEELEAFLSKLFEAKREILDEREQETSEQIIGPLF